MILGEEKWSAGLAGNFTGKALILEISVIHTLFFLFVCFLDFIPQTQTILFLGSLFFPTSKICVHSDFSLVDISIVLNGSFK